jgi:predicted secreted protein
MIVIDPGQTFEVPFEATPAAGYVWRMTDEASGIVELLGSDFKLAGALPGAPATQVFQLRALSAGETTLVFHYGRSWEPSPVKERSVKVRVQRTDQ